MRAVCVAAAAAEAVRLELADDDDADLAVAGVVEPRSSFSDCV